MNKTFIGSLYYLTKFENKCLKQTYLVKSVDITSQ